MTRRLGSAAILVALCSTCLLGLTAPAAGQTIIIEHRPPMPPGPIPYPRPRPIRRSFRDATLTVKRHNVEVSIIDGTAVTNVEQVFHNQHPSRVEGTYIFPLDDDVAVNKFSMFVGGKEIEGKLLGVEEARREYESIVAKMRDPALLEYIGTKMFRARIFPIEPNADVKIKLSYSQMLTIDNGLVRYRYPLDTEKYMAAPVESIGVLARIKSKTAIKSVFSPSHKIAVSRPSEYEASVSYEDTKVFPNRDFELLYSLSEKEFGLTVLTFREKGHDGVFLARIAPPSQTSKGDVLPKDIGFVFDTSGSMSGQKIEQAREALKFCLSNLNPKDRFNIIPFSHEPLKFDDRLVPASKENVEKARAFADGLTATGGTNINDAILAALASSTGDDGDRPYLIVFMTDGEATMGVTDTQEILKNVAGANTGRVRLFVFGVGENVNTQLLDLLAEQNRGARDYVVEGENLELKLSSFYRKVADPVLADLTLTFTDLGTYDLYPPKLPDLFAGSELVVTGRFKGEGGRAIELTGTRRGTKERFVYEATFPAEDTTHAFLPRLWATRKIGYLLDEIRLKGENKELKDTVVSLATKYGIVTPYTAMLVTEPGRQLARRERAAGDAFMLGLRSSPGRRGAPSANGGGALKKYKRRVSRNVQRIDASRSAKRAREADAGSSSLVIFDSELEAASGEKKPQPRVAYVGVRTFYRVKNRWIDGAYEQKEQTEKVELFSARYFELIHKHPDLAKCFALGQRVVVVIDGVAYETVPLPEDEQGGQTPTEPRP